MFLLPKQYNRFFLDNFEAVFSLNFSLGGALELTDNDDFVYSVQYKQRISGFFHASQWHHNQVPDIFSWTMAVIEAI